MEAFSAAALAMAGDQTAVDIAASLLRDLTEILPAASAAIMVKQGDGQLVLLHSSSHAAAQIEMLQIQSDRGPCVEAITADAVVTETGSAALTSRWGDVGAAVLRAGYEHVTAIPLRWHDRVLGGLNVFRADPEPMSQADAVMAQGFANMAALTLVHPSDMPWERLTARVAEAIQARSVIEQAKGVLAELHEVDLAAAYEMLMNNVDDEEQTITTVAARIVREQAR
jgi:GAF domain/ANTAR domain